jgi:leucyl aminopeptidase
MIMIVRAKEKNVKYSKEKKLIKQLGLMPPNVLTPHALASHFDESHWVGEHFTRFAGLHAVGGTKAYLGKSTTGNPDGAKTIAIVGKGITFDSGGISIKGSHNMHHMKFDMLGAATVLALKNTLKTCKHKVDLYGCCAENTFHDNTTRPGDVINYSDGTSVEIINTDAEGRLVLADGILAALDAKADLIITIATLTGSAKAALGEATAVFGNHEETTTAFLDTCFDCGELAWQLPIWDIHRKDIKGQKGVSTIKNQGTMAGASTAAAFLEHFIGGTNWLHLDIAGSAYKNDVPTGAMLDSLTRFLFDYGEENERN